MSAILELISELNKSNSSLYKRSVLERFKSEEIAKFLELTYDRLNHIYGIKKYKKILSNSQNHKSIYEIEEFLKQFENREVTGNKAIETLESFMESVSFETNQVLQMILDRDIHSGISTKQINKVYKNLIPEFPYMRCSGPDKLKNIRYPAMIQQKMDGTYRTFIKNGDEITSFSRSGEEYFHPLINEQLKEFQDGAYIGELICNDIEGDAQEARYKSNGLLNSLTPPDNVTFYMWDYLTLDEFKNGLSKVSYWDRTIIVNKVKKPNIKMVEHKFVNNFTEALEFFKDQLQRGNEGAVLKNIRSFFKNGTSTEQIKMKAIRTAEMRLIDITEGKGKFSSTFGALVFKSDDDKIEGQCSGIDDQTREYIYNNFEVLKNSIIEVEYSSLSKSKDSETYSLLFPRFKGFRNDKNETDTLERLLSFE